MLRRTGKVAKIVAFALAKRSLSLALGAGAVEAAGAVVTGLGEEAQSAVEEGAKEAASSSVEAAITTIAGVAPGQMMRKRIEAFEEGQNAIEDLKRSLAALITALEGEELRPPIIIIVDELDRCRPTYAIKLLEEVKHLFDVPGLVFIFGIHTEQLARSVSGAYGHEFDGQGYLRRFLNRQYRLAEPRLTPLVSKLASRTQGFSVLYSPMPQGPGSPNDASPPEMIAAYMRIYDMKARDAFEVIDILQTTVAITQGQRLHLPYLLPLIFGHIRGLPPGELPNPVSPPSWHLLAPIGRVGRTEINPVKLAEEYQAAALMPDEDIQSAWDDPEAITLALRAVGDNRSTYSYDQPLWAIENYPKLIRTVARFANPQVIEAPLIT